jgi:hypothetical protein
VGVGSGTCGAEASGETLDVGRPPARAHRAAYHPAVKLLATRKAHQNRRGLDPWTVVHLSTGLALGLMDVPLRRAVAAAVAYEVVEQAFERVEVGQAFFKTSGPEALLNVALDVVVLAVGHRLGQMWNAT